ncbi:MULTISPECIES: DUF6809 family protein [Paenibacillus]|uniref:DUF6809 family protein n=1 Tax=Paenibacillus TaxID=44249 RepID=UPI002FE0252D
MLEAFFHGEIHPEENIVPTNPKYRKISNSLSEAMELWKGKLSGDEFNQLEAMLDLRGQVESMHTTASFSHGFQLGALMMIEVYKAKGEYC